MPWFSDRLRKLTLRFFFLSGRFWGISYRERFLVICYIFSCRRFIPFKWIVSWLFLFDLFLFFLWRYWLKFYLLPHLLFRLLSFKWIILFRFRFVYLGCLMLLILFDSSWCIDAFSLLQYLMTFDLFSPPWLTCWVSWRFLFNFVINFIHCSYLLVCHLFMFLFFLWYC